MRTFARIALVGVLAATPVAVTAQPASACFSQQCLVNCVVDLATQRFCRL